jgi:hypothetical protein
MRKVFLALTALTIIGVSCQKSNEVSSMKETKQVVKQTRKKTQKLDYICVPFETKGFCSGPGNNCGKASKTSFTPVELQQADLLATYFAANNANGYFDTENWDILFEEVNEIEGLITDIQNGDVNFFQMQSGEDDGSVTYVLSTATVVTDVTTSNSIYAWQF